MPRPRTRRASAGLRRRRGGDGHVVYIHSTGPVRRFALGFNLRRDTHAATGNDKVVLDARMAESRWVSPSHSTGVTSASEAKRTSLRRGLLVSGVISPHI